MAKVIPINPAELGLCAGCNNNEAAIRRYPGNSPVVACRLLHRKVVPQKEQIGGECAVKHHSDARIARQLALVK